MRVLVKGAAAVALGLMLSAPAARAQGAEFSLGGGATVPLSTFGDFAKTGFNGMVAVSFAVLVALRDRWLGGGERATT